MRLSLHDMRCGQARGASFIGDLPERSGAPGNSWWQKDYFHGLDEDGTEHPEHQRKLHLSNFADKDPIATFGDEEP